MPILSDPKREKFANFCARGVPTIDAYTRAGYKRNTGNATTFRKRPDISKRIDELLLQMQNNNEEELKTFLEDTGLTQTYIIRAMLETAQEAKEAQKFAVAAETFKAIGSELFGMFMERKHLTVENNNVHPTATTTINIEGLNQALEGLKISGRSGPEIDGYAEILEPARALLPPEPLKR